MTKHSEMIGTMIAGIFVICALIAILAHTDRKRAEWRMASDMCHFDWAGTGRYYVFDPYLKECLVRAGGDMVPSDVAKSMIATK